MSSWLCMRCRTTYAVGLDACPQCGDTGYSEGGVVAKVNAAGVATNYVAEGQPVPTDLPPEVLLVGPGAPAAAAEAAAPAPDAVPDAPAEPEAAVQQAPEASDDPAPDVAAETLSEPQDDDEDDGPPDYGTYPKSVLADLCKERDLAAYGSKADMAARLAAYDQEHAA